ncbi:MAG: hypothetical protein AAGA43_07815 [Bacteroidota bacterium]
MKRICGFIVFTTLLLIKVSAFHVYTHHHDDCDSAEECEICDIVLDNQTSDFDVPQPAFLDTHQWVIPKELVILGSFNVLVDSKLNLLFCRPPPFS